MLLRLFKIPKQTIRYTTKLRKQKQDEKTKKINEVINYKIDDDDEKDISMEKPKIQLTLEQKIQRENERQNLYLKHDISLERKINQHALDLYYQKLEKTPINLIEEPHSTLNLLNECIKETLPQTEEYIRNREKQWEEIYNSLSIKDFEGKSWSQIKHLQSTMNPEKIINQKYDIQQLNNVPKTSLRCGAIGYKIGMTAIYDQWGRYTPLTVIQIDRNQVIGYRTEEQDGYNAIILGGGQQSFNQVQNNQIGQFLKANVPPKRHVQEFKVDPENFLPIGYMIGVRHFTVGQYVDVVGKTRGKGFMGVMKAWNFRGQRATHGTKQVQRHPGTIGNHQDPGRVWKKKKMAGRHGFKNRTIQKLQVYMIDFPRSLIFLKGSVMGPPKREYFIRDSFRFQNSNKNRINYPTFVYDKDGIYPDQIQVFPGEDDPFQQYLHDNQIAKQFNEEDENVDDEPKDFAGDDDDSGNQ